MIGKHFNPIGAIKRLSFIVHCLYPRGTGYSSNGILTKEKIGKKGRQICVKSIPTRPTSHRMNHGNKNQKPKKIIKKKIIQEFRAQTKTERTQEQKARWPFVNFDSAARKSRAGKNTRSRSISGKSDARGSHHFLLRLFD